MTARAIASADRSRRARLLGGSALGGAAALLLAATAQAQTLPTIPDASAITVATGGTQPTITAPDANSLDVDLKATRTVINWDSFHVSAADKVTFHFGATSDIVLNKSPTQVKVDAGGQVAGLVGADPGGAIWFYSPQGVVISPGAVMSAGNFVFARGDAIVDMAFVDAAAPLSVLRSASDSLIRIDTITSATSASINDEGELVLSATAGDLAAETVLAAKGATVTTAAGGINIGEVTAGEMASVTATGGDIALTSLNGGTGAGASGGAVTVASASASGAGADIQITGLTSASLGSGAAGRDIKVAGPDASLGSGAAGRDAFVTATTGAATVTGSVSAGDDIEVTATAGSVVAGSGSLTSTGAGADGGEAHVLARSTAGNVTVGSAATQGTAPGATGDVTVDAAAGTSILTAGASTRDIAVTGVTATLGSGAAGGDVTVTASGTANVTGAVSAGDDIEITANGGSVNASGASLTSTGANADSDAHVTVRSLSGAANVGFAATQGTGGARGDVRVEATSTATLSDGGASQDIFVLGPSAVLGSATASRSVFVTGTTGNASVTGAVTAGDDIEVTTTAGSVNAAGGTLTATGAGASDDAHILAKSVSGAVNVGSATTQGTGSRAGDVILESPTAASLGSGGSSRDIRISGQSASLGSADAARDIFVTATSGNASVTGAVTAGDDIEVTAGSGSVTAAGGSLTSTGVGAGDDAHVLARSTGGFVDVGSAATQGTGAALGDVTVDAATTATLGSGAASRDVNVLGPAASLGGGSAGRHVFVTATTGNAAVTGSVTAGNDIEVTSGAGDVTAAGGSLTSTGVGAGDDAHVLARSASGAVIVGAAATQGTGAALGDVTIESTTTATLGSGASSRDIKVTAPTASLGSANAARDVFVTATSGTASVTGAVTAGDDIEITATTGAVTAGGGSLTSTGVGASDDAHVLAKSASGAVTVGSATTQGSGAALGDVTVDAATTATVTGTLRSTQDVVVQAAGQVQAAASTMIAGRDAAVRSANASVAVGTIRAGDDIALRALNGSIMGGGDLRAGTTQGTSDPSGAADTLAGATLAGHDIDIRAPAVTVTGDVAAGRTAGDGESLDPVQLDSDVFVTVTAADPSPAVAALRLSTGNNSAVSAHRDIVLTSEGAVAATLQTGDVFAGRDVAVHAPNGAISMRSARAGDDVVLRAPNGMVEVIGDVQAGRDLAGQPTTDANGAGDDLNTALPFVDFDGNLGTVFKVVGFDVSITGQAVRITGTTVAGRQPSTDDPDTAGAVDNSTSDVRIETRTPMTPVIGLAPSIELGGVIATRDIQIDSAKAVTAGDLKAGRDIAILGRGGVTPGAAPNDHSGSGVTLGSARAGDDVLAFSVYGRTSIVGGATSGSPFPRLPVNLDRVTDGATEAADQLAIYLHYLNLDEESAPLLAQGALLRLVGQGVTVGGPLTAMGATSDVRIRSTLDIDVSGATHAGRWAMFSTDAGGGALKVGAVTAARDVLLDGATGVEATGTLTSSGSDVAVRSRGGGQVKLAGISAGDDIVVRTAGAVIVDGAVGAGGAGDSTGLGDDLRISDGAVTLEGVTFDLTGHDIDITAASVTTTGSMSALGGSSDVRIQSTGVLNLGDLGAGRDVLVDGATTVSTGVLTAGRDVGVRSTGANSAVTVGGAAAGDDVVIRAGGAINVTGPLGNGAGSDSADADQAGDLMFAVAKSRLGGDFDLAGRNVDVRSSGGAILATGAVDAADDARFQTGSAGSVKVGAVTAGRDVLLDGAGVEATDTLTSIGGDVAVRSRNGGQVRLAGVLAGDDLVVRTSGAVTLGGAVATGGGADAAGLGDTLLALEGAIVLEGQSFDLTGADIDIAAGSVTAAALLRANGSASDARIRAGGAASLANVTAGRDVLVDGGAAITTGVLTAARDVGVRSTGDGAMVTVGSAVAGDDVVVRARGAIRVTGALTAGAGADSADTDQAGDLMFGVARTRLAGDFDLTGGNVDLRSGAGSIDVSGAVTAATDARFQTEGAAGAGVKVGNVTAGRDVLLDGSAASGSSGVESTGTLMATTGDVAVRARNGSNIRLKAVTAGDDVAMRTTGALTTEGTVSTLGAASTLGVADRLTDAAEAGRLQVGGVAFDLASSDIDVVGGQVNIFRSAARGSARVKAGAVAMNGGAAVGIDILIDSEISLTVGDLTAAGDIALRSRSGSLTVGSLVAGDDIVLRGATGVTAVSLKSGGLERIGVGDQMYLSDPTLLGGELSLMGGTIDVRSGGGAISIGSADSAGDVRVQAASGDVTLSGLIVAGRDIFADGGSVNATGSLTAGGDVALYARTGLVSVGSVTAGDDLVIRAAGDVTTTGELKSGQGADVEGLADRLVTLTGPTSIFGVETTAAGGVIDISGANIRLGGVINAAGESAHLRLKSSGVTTLGDATLTGDIAIDSVGDVTAGALTAGRDLAVRSSDGSVALASGAAGDDIVLRAARSITVTGALSVGQGADGQGFGDVLFDLARTNLGGDFALGGRNIDILSASGDVTAGAITAPDDIRIQAANGRVTAADVDAGRDVLLDGGGVSAGAVQAGGDLAVRATNGALTLGSARAGDDLVVRARGDITVTGALTAGGGANGAGAGDRLAAMDGEATDLGGANIDIRSATGGVSAQGSLTAADDIRLRAAGAVSNTGRVEAGRDVHLLAASVAIGGELRAGRDAVLDSTGAVAITGRVAAGRDALLRAEGDVAAAGEVEAGRDVMLDGASVSAGTVRAGRDVAARGRTGSLTLGSIGAGDDVVLRAAQGITVTGQVTAQGGADGEGVADALFAAERTTLGGDFDLAGANVDIRGGAINVTGSALAGRDARFQTRGDGALSLNAVTAGGDILADGRSVTATGQLSAGRDVAVRARAGGVDLASVTAGDDIAIRAAGAVRASGALTSGAGANADGAADRLISAGEGGAIMRLVDPLATTAVVQGFTLAAGDIDIRSGEAISLAGSVGAANIRLQAATKITLASATAAESIFTRAADVSLGGAWRAQRARIEVTAASLNLGEGATGTGGVTLSSEQIGRIDAPVVQIFLGDTSGPARGGNISIGALAVDTAKIRTSLELYASSASDVVITGAFAPGSTATNTTMLRIGAADAAGNWTPRSIRVIANSGGSIGSALTTGGRTFTDVRAFNVVELNARADILMGYQDFIDRILTTSAASVPGAVKGIIAPQTTSGPRILLTAGSLILRADGKVAQQDTGGLLGTTPTGLYLLGGGTPQLLLGRTSATPGLPEFIELNGALTSGTTIMVGESVSLLAGIAFDRGVAPSGYYRLNTCAILQQGSCMPSNGHPTISIPPEQLTGLTLEDRTAAAGAADPTVASATNEEVWKDSN
ncbi:MAG: hypothetical protein JNL41_12580 [Phenylobacterium sp.]|uniref:beta strand repeat-containing protein n=1 Tax=Phenylobacterium sp. TaxID=1871053 RepID=UPI001A550375|nr:hypothetical protein [Phenylobacterium sp.]MBL8555110.1 hypothetical protein [Phenylobacterium sp.]